jgi:phosphomannomutase
MLGKVFKAYDVRAVYPRPLNEKAAWQIGFAVADYLLEVAAGKGRHDPMGRYIVVGRDMRTSSPSLCESLINGIRDRGGHVIEIDEVDTSMVYFAINHLDAAGGVMVTASHNPAKYNGFKISGIGAKPIGEGTGLEEIRRRAALANQDRPKNGGGLVESRDLWPAYRNWLVEKLDPRLRDGSKKLKVVVDASNGMAGKMVPEVFGDVAGLELIPINFKMDGTFVHEPNPLVDKNLIPTQEGVREHAADFGVCFDGDADRCMVIDEKGDSVGCDKLLSWWVADVLRENPGAPIVYDLRSTRALREAIDAEGGVAVESRVGHVFMKAALANSGAIIGGELSGHFYFKDAFGADSGARAFVEVCNRVLASKGTLSSSIAPHDRYVQTGELNFKVEDSGIAMEAVAALFPDAERTDLDGMSLDAGPWWCNIRSSNTEPLLRLNLESADQATLDETLEILQGVLGSPVDH